MSRLAIGNMRNRTGINDLDIRGFSRLEAVSG
jgi:hypothetical protein